jgi:hypothetical protein
MKIDVEGFEHEVLKGGVNLFTLYPIKFILMEFNENQLKINKADTKQMFKQLGSWGYNFSTKSFAGPWTSLDKFQSFTCFVCSIYLRHYTYSNKKMSPPRLK